MSQQDYKPGDIVWYHLGETRDPEQPGIRIIREVVALVTSVGHRRVVIAPYFDGMNAPPARKRGVRHYHVRPL